MSTLINVETILLLNSRQILQKLEFFKRFSTIKHDKNILKETSLLKNSLFYFSTHISYVDFYDESKNKFCWSRN